MTQDWNKRPGRRRTASRSLSASRNSEFRSDVQGNVNRIIVHEVSDFVVRDAPQLGPFAQGADGRLVSFGKYAACSQPNDVREAMSEWVAISHSGFPGRAAAVVAALWCCRRKAQ